MEAAPKLPLIYFQLKSSPESADFSTKLKQYIGSFYNEDPETYNKEIRELETLRQSACRVQMDFTGCSTLKKYYSQLQLLQNRFPMSEGGVASISFTWNDVYSGATFTCTDIKEEQACILYNIGALHSELGAIDSRQTSEGMKISCTHFQCAAWAFQHLRDNLQCSKSPDMSQTVLSFYIAVMLGQAQECILEKSMLDNRKSTIIAKIAAQIVEYYRQALKTLDAGGKTPESRHVAIIAGSKYYKAWKKHLEFKMAYHSCITCLYMGIQAEELQKMGERVGYFQAALDKLNEASKLAKGLEKDVSDALTFTMDVVGGKLNAASKENEFVYHEKVPTLDALPEVKGASLVKGIPFHSSNPEISGPDIFARLVPMKAHEASSLYSEEKAKLLRRVSTMIEEKGHELTVFMSSLQLEQLRLNPEPVSLPQELVDCCASLSVRPTAIKDLVMAMQNLSGLFHDVDSLLREMSELLEHESKEEDEFKKLTSSKRPPSMVLQEIKKELAKYQEAHQKASESNVTLHKVMDYHISNLNLLCGSLDELSKHIPSLDILNVQSEDGQELQKLINKVEEMKMQRHMFETQLREQIQADDITKQLVASDQNLQGMFSKELEKHNRLVALLEQNLSAQDNILRRLTEVNAKYAETRRATVEICRKREAVIRNLIASYEAYGDLVEKSQKGIEFYKKLESGITKLLQRARSVCKVQEEERTKLMESQVGKGTVQRPSAAKPPPQAVTGTGPKLKDYLRYMTPGAGGSALSGIPPGSATPPDVSGAYQTGVGGLAHHQLTPNIGSRITEPSIPQLQIYSEKTLDPPGVHYDPDTNQLPPGIPTEMRPAPVGSEQTDIPQSYCSGIYSRVSQPAPKVTSLADYEKKSYFGGYSPALSIVSDREYAQPRPDLSSASSMGFGQPQQGPTSGSWYAPSSHVQGTRQPSYSADASQGPVLPPGVDPRTVTSHQWPAAQGQYPPSGGSLQTAGGSYQDPSTKPAWYPGSQLEIPTYPSTSMAAYTPGHQPPQDLSSRASYPGDVKLDVGQQQPVGTIMGQMTGLPGDSPQGPIPGSIQAAGSYPVSQVGSTYPASQAGSSYHATQAGTFYRTSQAGGSYPTPQAGSSYPTPQAGGSYPTSQAGGSYPTSQAGGSYPTSQAGGSYPTSQAGDSYPTSQAGDSYPVSQAGSSYPMSSVVAPPPMIPSSTTGVTYSTATQGFASLPQAGSDLPSPYSSAYPTDSMRINHPPSGPHPQVSAPGPVQTQVPMLFSYPGAQPGPHSLTPGSYFPGNSVAPAHALQNVSSAYNSMLQPLQPHPAVRPQSAAVASSTVLVGPQSQKELPSSNLDLLQQLDFNAPSSVPTPEQKPVRHVTPAADLVSGSPISTSAPKQEILKPKLTPSTDNQPEMDKEAEGKKSVPKDSFLDKETLTKFVIDVERFQKVVEWLSKQTLNGPTALEQKWKELMDTQDRESRKLSISVARCCALKNRMQDIMPYDFSRVVLGTLKDDYINASHLKDLSKNTAQYIATQAPLSTTFKDFWAMIYEQQIEVIAALICDTELKGDVYWPTEKNQMVDHDVVSVCLQSSKSKPWGVERLIFITNQETRISRAVMHLQFTAWPPGGIPTSPAQFLQFVADVHYYHREQRSVQRPVVVHCSAGVGRTGVFILVSTAVHEVNAGNGIMDLWTTAARMTQMRKYIMQDKEHMRFAFHAVLYYAEDCLLKRGILIKRASFEDKMSATTSHKSSHTRHPSQDFILGPPGPEVQPTQQADPSSKQPPSVSVTGHLSQLHTPAASRAEVENPKVGNEDLERDQPPPSARSRSNSSASVASVSSSTSSTQGPLAANSPQHQPPKIKSVCTLPPSLANLDAVHFTLDPATTKKPKRITKDSFLNSGSRISDVNDPADPLSQLDPLWSLHK